MKLRCIRSMVAHWGIIFDEGKEYDVSKIIEHPIVVLTDYKRYWELNKELLTSYHKYEESKRNGLPFGPGVIDDEEFSKSLYYSQQKSLSSEQKLYQTKISLPHCVIKSDDYGGSVYNFLISSDEELFQLGVDKKEDGSVAIGPYTVYRVDEYFDFKSERRDKKLKELGI